MTSENSTIPSIVDSHAHLNMQEFDQDRSRIIKKAFEEGVQAILCPSDLTEPDRHHVAIQLSKSNTRIFVSAGVHPHQAKNFTTHCEDQITELARDRSIVAVGEIGLDFHYNFSPPSSQKEVFRKQLEIAQDLGLPVIIHSRNAGEQVVEIIKSSGFDKGGVLHCYTEDWIFARQMLQRGFYISFSGIVTFPKAHELREVARKIPVDSLMVETDSPYLVPSPFRGKIKRNEPRFVIETARFMADLKACKFEDLARITTDNFYRCFRIEINKSR
jgi:TatD DNase family protein